MFEVISKPSRYSGQPGWTLIELVLVILLISILSTIAFRSISSTLTTTRFEATSREMDNIAQAILGNPELITASGRTDYGYVGDTGQMPPDLDALVSDPDICGWDGPYLTVDVDEDGNAYKTDSWGNEYTFSIDGNGNIRLTSDSAGTKTIGNTSHILQNSVQVQVYNSDGTPLDNTSGDVAIEYGCTWNYLGFNKGTGKFVDYSVPIGHHRIRVSGSADTSYNYIGVVPASEINLEMTIYPQFGELVSNGCGGISGTGNYIVSEQISNTGSPTFIIEDMMVNFSNSPCVGCDDVYLERIEVDSDVYWDHAPAGSRIGSGVTVSLDQLLYIYSGLLTIDLFFNNSATGAGNPVDMTGSTMSVQFFPNNGSTQLVPFSACGAGCTSPTLSYAGGSATVSGANKQTVTFNVRNSGDLAFDVISLPNLTWTEPGTGSCWRCGTAYLSILESGGTTYWDYSSDGNGTRATSGNTLTLSSPLDLPNGDIPIIMTFNNANSGAGADIDMSNVDFNITFRSSCVNFGPNQSINFIASGGAATCAPCNLSLVNTVASGTPKSDQLQITMSNNGDPCEITTIKVTSGLTSANDQPWVETVKEGTQTVWTYQSAGARANTTSGSETIMVLSPTISLTQADATLDMIQFADNKGKAININGATMTVEFTISCCDCTTPQTVSFTVN